jgi:triosephosphate isomerase
MSKKRLVVGNWKMYLESPEQAKHFAQALRKRARSFAGVEVWLAPSYPFIPAAVAALKGSKIKVGAQAVSPYDEHAHTGEVSATILKSAGASFAIVGHSEQRLSGQGAQGLSDELVHASLVRATSAGLTAILCVGERERDQAGSHFAFIEGQLRTAFAGAQSLSSRVIIAYEPVWAIGHGAADSMSPASVEEMVIFIRKTLAEILTRGAALRVPVLYGGSVEPDNAALLIDEGGVNGFLVGHASAALDPFIEILRSCKK